MHAELSGLGIRIKMLIEVLRLRKDMALYRVKNNIQFSKFIIFRKRNATTTATES